MQGKLYNFITHIDSIRSFAFNLKRIKSQMEAGNDSLGRSYECVENVPKRHKSASSSSDNATELSEAAGAARRKFKIYDVYKMVCDNSLLCSVHGFIIPKSPFNTLSETDGVLSHCAPTHTEAQISYFRDNERRDARSSYGISDDDDDEYNDRDVLEDKSLTFGKHEEYVFSNLAFATMLESGTGARLSPGSNMSDIFVDGFCVDQVSKIEQVNKNEDIVKLVKRAEVVGDNLGTYPLFLPVNACVTNSIPRITSNISLSRRFGFSTSSRNLKKSPSVGGLVGLKDLRSGNDIMDMLLTPEVDWSPEILKFPMNGECSGFGFDEGLIVYQDYKDSWRYGHNSHLMNRLESLDYELDTEIKLSRVPEGFVHIPSWTDLELRYTEGKLSNEKSILTDTVLGDITDIDAVSKNFKIIPSGDESGIAEYENISYVGPIGRAMYDIGLCDGEDISSSELITPKYSNDLRTLLGFNSKVVAQHTLLRRATGGIQTLDKGGCFLDVNLPFLAYNEYIKCIPDDILLSQEFCKNLGTTNADIESKLADSYRNCGLNYFVGKIHDVQRRVDSFSKKYGAISSSKRQNGDDDDGTFYALLYEVKSPISLNQHSLEWTQVATYMGSDFKLPVTLHTIPHYNYEYTCGPDSWVASLYSAISMSSDIISANSNEVITNQPSLTDRVDGSMKVMFQRFTNTLNDTRLWFQNKADLKLATSHISKIVESWSALEQLSLVSILKWTMEKCRLIIFENSDSEFDIVMDLLADSLQKCGSDDKVDETLKSSTIRQLVRKYSKSFELTGKWDDVYFDYAICLYLYENIIAPCIDDISSYSASLTSGRLDTRDLDHPSVKYPIYFSKYADQRSDGVSFDLEQLHPLNYGRFISMEPLRRHWLGDSMTVGRNYKMESEMLFESLLDLYKHVKALSLKSSYVDQIHGDDIVDGVEIEDLISIFEECMGMGSEYSAEGKKPKCDWMAFAINTLSGETIRRKIVSKYQGVTNMVDPVLYDFERLLGFHARTVRFEGLSLWYYGINLDNSYSSSDVLLNYCNLLTSTSAIRFDGVMNAKNMGLPEELWNIVDEQMTKGQNAYSSAPNSSDHNNRGESAKRVGKNTMVNMMLRDMRKASGIENAFEKTPSPYDGSNCCGPTVLLDTTISKVTNELLYNSKLYPDGRSVLQQVSIDNDRTMLIDTGVHNRSEAGANSVDFRRIADIDNESLLHLRDLMRFHVYDAAFLSIFQSKLNANGSSQANRMDWNTAGCSIDNLTNVPYGPNFRSVEDFSFWQFGRSDRVIKLITQRSNTEESKYPLNAFRASIFLKTCENSLTGLRNHIISTDSDSVKNSHQGSYSLVDDINGCSLSNYKSDLAVLELNTSKRMEDYNDKCVDIEDEEIISNYDELTLSEENVGRVRRFLDAGRVLQPREDGIGYGSGRINFLDFLYKVKSDRIIRMRFHHAFGKLDTTRTSNIKSVTATKLESFMTKLDQFSKNHLSEPVSKFGKVGVISYTPINCWNSLYDDSVLGDFNSLTCHQFDNLVEVLGNAQGEISKLEDRTSQLEYIHSLVDIVGGFTKNKAKQEKTTIKRYYLRSLSDFYAEALRRGDILRRLFKTNHMSLSFYSTFYSNGDMKTDLEFMSKVPPYFLDTSLYPFYASGAYSSANLHEMQHFSVEYNCASSKIGTTLPKSLRKDPYTGFCYDTMAINNSGKMFKFSNGVNSLNANQLSWSINTHYLHVGDTFSMNFGMEGLNCISLGDVHVMSLNLERVAEYFTEELLSQEMYLTMIECKNMFLNIARCTGKYTDLNVSKWRSFEVSACAAMVVYNDVLHPILRRELGEDYDHNIKDTVQYNRAQKTLFERELRSFNKGEGLAERILYNYNYRFLDLCKEVGLKSHEFDISPGGENDLTPSLWFMIVLYKTFFIRKTYVPTGFVLNQSGGEGSGHFVSEFSLPSWYATNVDDLLKPISGKVDLERLVDAQRCSSSDSTMEGALYDSDIYTRGKWYYYDDLRDSYNENTRNSTNNFEDAAKKWIGMSDKDLDFYNAPLSLSYASNPSSWIHALNTNVHVKCDTSPFIRPLSNGDDRSHRAKSFQTKPTDIQKSYNLMILDCRDDLARYQQFELDSTYKFEDAEKDPEFNPKYWPKSGAYLEKTERIIRDWKKRVDKILDNILTETEEYDTKISRLPLVMRQLSYIDEIKPLQKYLVLTPKSGVSLSTIHYVRKL